MDRRIALLGPVRAYVGASPIVISGTRLRMLLARLALDAGRVVPADVLIDGVWGAAPPADAANALQALVSRLRRALGGAIAVESGTGGYRLAVDPEDVDAHRFEELAARGRRELAADRPREASELLGAALGMWRGAALADLGDAEFARAPAARLGDLRETAAEDRFDAELRLGRHAEVLPDLEMAAAAHPLRERLAALRMRALHAVGRRSDALLVFEHTRRVLAEELGVDPDIELSAAHLAVVRGVSGGAAQQRSLRPGRLPVQLTSFVGRAREQVELARRVASSRLVTVVGPGGVGKTRLTVEVLARQPVHEHGRVWFVPLAGVRSAAGVIDAVLGALGADRFEQDLLGAEHAVLVLDNCEHLVDAVAAAAVELLDRLPAVTVVATSRESLGVVGESLCPVGPLDLPAAAPQLADAAEVEAVRLFVDRAVAVRPGFALDDTTLGAVVTICRRLDGLPLALELAAARLRALPVASIAQRLDDRFRLLTSGNRAALPHQRTLRGAVEWSWNLLTEGEQTLARRLAVFPGRFGAHAPEIVCSDRSLPAADIGDVLGALVEKSVVEADGDRYRLLETIRIYAAEQLSSAGELESVRSRYAALPVG